jgi:hypothetical protein
MGATSSGSRLATFPLRVISIVGVDVDGQAWHGVHVHAADNPQREGHPRPLHSNRAHPSPRWAFTLPVRCARSAARVAVGHG